MRKIKVLQVIGNLKIGGAENVAMNYYRYIDRNKFEFNYLVFGQEVGHYEKEVEELGGKVIHMDNPSKNYLTFRKNLEKIMKDNGPFDIVHSHTLFNSGFVLHAAKRVGIERRIAHSHSTKNKLKTSIILKLYESIMRSRIRKYATDTVACSLDAGLFLYGKRNKKKEIVILRNGIDINKYKFDGVTREKIRRALGIDHKFVVGHVGHFAPVKNHSFIIDIFNSISQAQEDAILVLIGEGNERQRILERLTEYNLHSKVIFTGNIDNVNDLLQALDVFIFPSLYEGLGLAVIEAQAAGLPCVISDRIPSEVLLTSSVSQVSLDEPPEYWASIILGHKHSERSQCHRIVSNKGYDIREVGKKLECFYLKGMGFSEP